MLYQDIKESLMNENIVEYVPLNIGNGKEIQVRTYLPLQQKVELLQYVIDLSQDQETGCFSPIKVDVFFSLGVLKYYCDIDFGEEDLIKAYDLLESRQVIDKIFGSIPREEIDYMKQVVEDTIKDIARYNNSFTGVVKAASNDAGALSDSFDNIMKDIRDKRGLEILDSIKNVVGTV